MRWPTAAWIGLSAAPPPVAHHAMDAHLDVDTHRVEGRLELTWTHPGEGRIDHVPFHLYMNAFRSASTPWMAAAEHQHRGIRPGDTQRWGSCEIATVEQRTRAGQWIPTTASERQDPTLADVALVEPVLPGETLTLALTFTTQLPEVFARTGYRRDFYMVAQWYPHVARRSGQQWTDFEFHHHGEFDADFADYDVTLDLPLGLVVGGTGEQREVTTAGDRQSVHYVAENVHDFAWTAWANFERESRQVGGVAVQVLYPPASAEDVPLHWTAIEATLSSLQRRFGPYPWSSLTVVEPPTFAAGASGMEYPTFVTTDPARGLPRWLAAFGYDHRLHGQATTVHELGHQYFQGLVANNEDAEPWLDEGLTTFASMLVLEDTATDEPWLVRVAGHSLPPETFLRLVLRDRPAGPPSASPAAAFDPADQSYGTAVYYWPAAWLMSLRRLTGSAAFDQALAGYVDRFRFGHPTTDDFEDALAAAWQPAPRLGPSIAPGRASVLLEGRRILRHGLHDHAMVNFAVRRVANLRRPTGDAWIPLALIVVERDSAIPLPVEIEVEFDDGTIERGYWDGPERSLVVRWPDRKILRASIDPRGQWVAEVDRHDNHRYAPRLGVAPPGPARALGAVSEALALALSMVLAP